MSRIVSDLIRSKIDAVDEDAANTLAWLISKKLPPDAGLDDIEEAIGQARGELGPLFRRAEPRPEPEAEAPKMTGMRAAPSRDRTSDRIRTATAGGNPYAAGSINRTRQTMLEHADPALAAKLKAEAGR